MLSSRVVCATRMTLMNISHACSSSLNYRFRDVSRIIVSLRNDQNNAMALLNDAILIVLTLLFEINFKFNVSLSLEYLIINKKMSARKNLVASIRNL